MLSEARLLGRALAGFGSVWRRPFAEPQPRAAVARASVWFTAYPAATIGRPGESVLQTFGDPDLWVAFQRIGIQGIHTGPMKLAGGVRGHVFTPTVDGYFDRIGMPIDPVFGTVADYKTMVANARASGAIVIGDIIPGHTGKGPDFRLAERAYGDYPGLYHMVAIPEAEWPLLPPVPSGKDSVNLSPAVVDELAARGHILGQLPRTIFYEKGVKETDWTATDVVTGVDGKRRRWVYLHYFKEGQPTLNWLDPTFAAQRLVIGDAIHSLGTLGESMLRVDANGFLGVEVGRNGARAWSEGHPLSITANQIISGMVRKLGAYTFQELNLTLEDIRDMSKGGADLSYDFVSRPAYHHALVTGDAEFLRLMLALQQKYGIDPAALVHALQNHDELTLELVHFWTRHKDDVFVFHGKPISGSTLRDRIRSDVTSRVLAPAAPYNLEAPNGVAATSVSLVAASLGLKVEDWSKLTPAERADVQRAHLLLAMFNAMQPGVFALSGWDLVGAATLPPSAVAAQLADGDTRWINRGAYDLLGHAPGASRSASGLPRAHALYGPIDAQLRDPASFASQLAKMLRVRAEEHLYEAERIALPAVTSPGLVVLVHRLPGSRGIEVTALNFGRRAVNEEVTIDAAPRSATITDLLEGKPDGRLAGKRLTLALAPLQGRALVLR